MRIVLSGAAGAMGQTLVRLLGAGYCGGQAVALVDAQGGPGILTDFSQVTAEADAVLDFSFHTATAGALAYALAHRLPLVVGTTGHTPREKAAVEAAAREIPVFYSGNMSLGIAVLCRLVREAVRAFPDADVEIVEAHHNRKVDAPSGTALMLFQAAQEVRPQARPVCGRSGQARREKEDIGISSLRLGGLVGVHEVIISTGTQTLTLRHEAHDRALFAQGALEAAAYLLDRPAGLYGMEDLVKSRR